MNRKHTLGFTLIELMIVVAIIGILAAVAYPSYSEHVRKGNRSAAQQVMLNIASRQQQYMLDARSYTTDLSSAGVNIPSQDGWTCLAASCSNSFYTITVAVNNAATPPTYTITATATGSQTADGNMTLTSTGAKTLGSATKW